MGNIIALHKNYNNNETINNKHTHITHICSQMEEIV